MNRITLHYYFSDPEQIFDSARQLAARISLSKNILVGIYELMLNAVEHGNLAMDSHSKCALLRKGLFAEEMKRQMMLEENSRKYVEVVIDEHEYFNCLTIRDSGNGFDWRQGLNHSYPSQSTYGRGLLIARDCGFEAMAFNEKGNSVTCIVKNQNALSELLMLAA